MKLVVSLMKFIYISETAADRVSHARVSVWTDDAQSKYKHKCEQV